ncbi:3-keto-disaccharide hydrolase [Pseudochryseolinea flava]|uniref:DUF1080 domain-containing protein n=1 Tax=Pseudochryseolinea flava TaxID=2059302 RepID=A0A364YBC4_9BACT|nr:DUF1080 domain-containing protein [Pseudochryseolinea flava]RAW03392.1 DUF1080 domain-containing protein [Pseudochryseolinea flava]
MTNRILMFLLVLSIPSFAQKKDKTWRYLFNGKDLSGWKQVNGKAPYAVENGMIVGTTVAESPNSFLATEELFGDFIFEVEFKMDDGTNSGVQFRSEQRPEDGKVFGYQLDIDPTPRKWCGGIYDESRRQWLYPLEYNVAAKNAYKNQLWNTIRIEAIGSNMRTWINGIPCANIVDDMTPKGFIALQVHSINDAKDAGKKVWFKNIRIKTENLQASPIDNIFQLNLLPNKITEQEKANGIVLLWDGKTTEGWRGAYKDKFPEAGWEIKDGTLSVVKSDGAESRNGGDIVSNNEYAAFDLQFEFKLTEGANSGVKYFVTEKENNQGSAIGLEFQILDDDKHPDAKMGVVGNRTLSSLYDLIPAAKNPRGIKKIGEWNQGRVIVYPDNRVEHWLNGYKVIEYTRGNNIFKALVARSKYADWQNFGMAEQGRILLQDHGDKVSFRSIKIKILK